eukprot:Skav212919  [mRNA]  locus=scaffold374:222978:226461:- [translate_table: standard]
MLLRLVLGSVWLGKKFGKGRRRPGRDTWEGHLGRTPGRSLSSSLRTFLSAKSTSRDSVAVASCLSNVQALCDVMRPSRRKLTACQLGPAWEKTGDIGDNL